MLIPDYTDPDVKYSAHLAVLPEVPAECGFRLTAWTLPAEKAARRARGLLRRQVAPFVRDEAVLADLELMVCELSTNAVMHTDGPYELRIIRHTGIPVACEIADAGGGLDRIVEHLRRSHPAEVVNIDVLELGGRGLGVVAHLSAGRCGVHTTRLCCTGQPGKSIWFAIPVDGSAERERMEKALRTREEQYGPARRASRKTAVGEFLEVKSALELRTSGRY